MLIEVKSTQKAEPAAQGRQRFEFATAERLSRLPAVFALIIVSIAAYLRSMMPALARTEEATAKAGDGEQTAAPNDKQIAQLETGDLAAAGIDETETGSVDDGTVGNSIGRGNPWPPNFEIPDFPQMHFVAPSFFVPDVAPFVPVALVGQPNNDNFRFDGGTGVSAGQGSQSKPADPTSGGEGAADADEDDDDADENEPEHPDDVGNRAPVVAGPVRLNDVFAGQVVLIGLVQLLRGASDPDDDTLHVEQVSVTGAELVASDSGWLIKSGPGMVGPVVLTYRISDGEAWVPQTARLDIVRKQFEGTSADDIIIGSPYDDDIDAGDGDDLIDAGEGNDHVEGGPGDDHIVGGAGDDVLVGGRGHDVMFGGVGNDLIEGGYGNDRLFGEGGRDTLFGGGGDDYLDGGAANDHLDGGDGCDTLVGGEGDDRLIGGHGADRLEGGLGNDLVEGGAGNDVLVADAGDDVMIGGEGRDVLDASAASGDLVVDLVGGTLFSSEEELGTDHFSSIEQVIGGAGDDLFVVGGKASILSGGYGRDTFVFEVTDAEPCLSGEIVHQILDFVVGDRVRVRDYHLDRDQRRAEQDLFETVYGDDDDDWLRSDIPIKLRHERIDDEDWTIILADIDGDDAPDIAINIQGLLLAPADHLA